MFLALLAFVGLAADGGILYVTYSQLRRATDAAALSVAAQLREVRSPDELNRTAEEALRLQGLAPIAIGAPELNPNDGIDDDGDGCVDDPDKLCFKVEKCDWLYGGSYPDPLPSSYTDPRIKLDPAICSYPARKLVRVKASTSAPLAFMRLWGWERVRLDANATSESAALDVVLVLDLSYSMTWDASRYNGVDDDGDGCADETLVPGSGVGGCSDANGHPDDWLGAPKSNNGKKDPAVADRAPVGTWGKEDLPDTTPFCTEQLPTALGTLRASYLPADLKYDFGAGDVPVSPLTACRPFEYVRDAAIRFVTTYMDFPYDRVGIVTFASAACPPLDDSNYVGRPYDYDYCTNGIKTQLRQSIGSGDNESDSVRALSVGGATGYGTLNQLDVSASPPCHGDGDLANDLFPNFWYGGQPGVSPGQAIRGAYGECENTNTGEGLYLAFLNLNQNQRSNAMRIIVLLSDGAASTSAHDAAVDAFGKNYYACPNDRVNGDPYGLLDGVSSPATNHDIWFDNRPCQDGDSRNFGTYRHTSDEAKYDADDYARDQADAISLAGETLIFTIGLGSAVTNNPTGCDPTTQANGADPNAHEGNPDCLPNGEQLLRYIADKGDGINPPDPDPCGRDDSAIPAQTAPNYFTSTATLYLTPNGQSCGNYFFAQGGLNVRSVFQEIAKRIFTRLTQ